MDRSSRTVLTTGASSGIGLATAVAVARAGWRSAGTVRSDAGEAALLDAAAAAGVQVTPVRLDVTDAGRCAEVVEDLAPWGLVNNAGYALTGAVEDVDDDEARAQLEVMVVAPARLARLALPHMRGGGGRIVNVSSLLGRTTAPLVGWYSASKHALEALSDALRVEVAGDGVRVVLVEPGGIRTGIWDGVDGDLGGRPGSRYGGAYRRSALGLRLTRPIMGSPGGVAATVVRALGSRVPRDRYLVGLDAVAATAASRLAPAAVRDLAARAGLGL